MLIRATHAPLNQGYHSSSDPSLILHIEQYRQDMMADRGDDMPAQVPALNGRYDNEAPLSRQVTVTLAPEDYERLFFQPSPARGDLAKRLGIARGHHARKTALADFAKETPPSWASSVSSSHFRAPCSVFSNGKERAIPL